jgi:hypothetical protein
VRTPEEGKQTFYKVRKSQIRKFLGSFRYRKSANFLGVLSANWQIVMINPQIENPQVSTAYCTNLSQNNYEKSSL